MKNEKANKARTKLHTPAIYGTVRLLAACAEVLSIVISMTEINSKLKPVADGCIITMLLKEYFIHKKSNTGYERGDAVLRNL
jgi:hypothetical protein